MTILHPDMRATWATWSARFEGRIPWLYLDVRGLPTTAIGYLVPDLTAMLALPWRTPSNLPASRGAIEGEWYRVRAERPALKADEYRSRDALHIDDDAIDALTLRRLDAMAEVLARHFPALADYPEPAQRALMSMAWAMGPNFPAKGWPRFSAAVRAQDWPTAAAECLMRTAGNPGLVPRNKANVQLFERAAVMQAAPVTLPMGMARQSVG